MKKILLFVLAFAFIFQITLLVFMPTIPVQADDKKEKGIKFNPQISIPGSDFQHSDDPKKYMTITPTTLGKYIKGIYTYAIGVVGILSTAVIIFGGFLWATAAGNNSRVDNAKTWIGSALTGLVLALFSYTLLYMINPALVELKSLDITPITKLEFGCCMPYGTDNKCENIEHKDCDGEFNANAYCNEQIGECEALYSGNKCSDFTSNCSAINCSTDYLINQQKCN